MNFEKKIPGYVVTGLFALSGILYLGAYAYAMFANVAAGRVPLMLVITLLAVALAALVSFLCLYFNGKVKKTVAEAMTDKLKWQRIFIIAAIAVGVIGFLFRIVQIVAASDLPENNPIYRAALNGAYSDDSSGGIRVQLYITILSAMIKPFGAGFKTTLVMQTFLYLIAAAFVFFAVWFLCGRLPAVITTAGMLFLPVFPDAKTPSDAVMFWLMLGAGLLVGAVFLRYAREPEEEYPLYMKIMISVFTGLLVGIIIGWDAGLVLLLLPVVYVFFTGKAKPKKMLPLAGAFFAATIAGFFVSVASFSTWAKYYFSDVSAGMPLVKENYTVLIFLFAALSMLGISVFFCLKKHENVTYFMLFAMFAMWFASRMTLSGVYAAGFPVLLFLCLFGTGLEGLLSDESRDVLKAAGAVVKRKPGAKKKEKAEKKTARAEEPVPKEALPAEKKEEAVTGPKPVKKEDDEVDEMLEHVWVEQIVAEAMGEDVSEEKQAIREALAAEAAEKEKETPQPAPVPVPEVPAKPAESAVPEAPAKPAESTAPEDANIPSGMVLPAGDARVDDDDTPRLPVRMPRRLGEGPISLKRTEAAQTPAAPAVEKPVAAPAAAAAAIPATASAVAAALSPAMGTPQPAPVPKPPAKTDDADSEVAEIVRRISEHSKRMMQEQENAVKDYSPEEVRRLEELDIQRREERTRREEEAARAKETGAEHTWKPGESFRSREDEEARRRMEEARRLREEEERRSLEEGSGGREEEERRRREEEEARRRREEEDRRRQEEEYRRREEEERRRREEEDRRRQEEEYRRREEEDRRQREEEARRRQEEEYRRREEERRRQEEERTRREEEERRLREEEEERRRREEARRQRGEEERRRRELEEARIRREEEERRAREEYERRRREEDEAEARRREEYDRRRREEEAGRWETPHPSAAPTSAPARDYAPAPEPARDYTPTSAPAPRRKDDFDFDFDISSGDDFDI